MAFKSYDLSTQWKKLKRKMKRHPQTPANPEAGPSFTQALQSLIIEDAVPFQSIPDSTYDRACTLQAQVTKLPPNSSHRNDRFFNAIEACDTAIQQNTDPKRLKTLQTYWLDAQSELGNHEAVIMRSTAVIQEMERAFPAEETILPNTDDRNPAIASFKFRLARALNHNAQHQEACQCAEDALRQARSIHRHQSVREPLVDLKNNIDLLEFERLNALYHSHQYDRMKFSFQPHFNAQNPASLTQAKILLIASKGINRSTNPSSQYAIQSLDAAIPHFEPHPELRKEAQLEHAVATLNHLGTTYIHPPKLSSRFQKAAEALQMLTEQGDLTRIESGWENLEKLCNNARRPAEFIRLTNPLLSNSYEGKPYPSLSLYERRAHAYRKLGESSQAENEYLQALSIAGRNNDAFNVGKFCLATIDLYAEKEEHLKILQLSDKYLPALELNQSPQLPSIYAHRILAHQKLDNIQEASREQGLLDSPEPLQGYKHPEASQGFSHSLGGQQRSAESRSRGNNEEGSVPEINLIKSHERNFVGKTFEEKLKEASNSILSQQKKSPTTDFPEIIKYLYEVHKKHDIAVDFLDLTEGMIYDSGVRNAEFRPLLAHYRAASRNQGEYADETIAEVENTLKACDKNPAMRSLLHFDLAVAHAAKQEDQQALSSAGSAIESSLQTTPWTTEQSEHLERLCLDLSEIYKDIDPQAFLDATNPVMKKFQRENSDHQEARHGMHLSAMREQFTLHSQHSSSGIPPSELPISSHPLYPFDPTRPHSASSSRKFSSQGNGR